MAGEEPDAEIITQVDTDSLAPPIEVGCADIYRFMGKKPRANSQAEPSSRMQTLVQGMRLKHTLGATSLKMYDKAGCVLRIECTTSDVTAFQHRRKMEPRRSAGSGTSQSGAGSSGGTKWVPIRKTFYRLDAVAEAMSACNRRYLADISQWRDRTRDRHALGEVTTSHIEVLA